MGSFEIRKPISDIMKFVGECPFLDEFKIDMNPASIGRLSTMVPDGSMVSYAGSVVVADKTDIIRATRRVTRQSNFQLVLLRKSNHEEYRHQIADFLFNFEHWIDYMQFHGLTPKLSTADDYKEDEVMWADNGMYYSEWEGEESSLYLVQLHIRHTDEYIREGIQ